MKYWIYILLPIVLLVSCTQKHPVPLTETEKAAITREVEHTLQQYCAVVKKGGLMAEFEFLDQSADFSWAPPGYKSTIGFDSVKSLIVQNAGRYKLVDNHYEILSIEPVALSMANYTARVHSHMVDTAGHSVSTDLLEVGVMLKTRSGWKLHSGVTTVIR